MLSRMSKNSKFSANSPRSRQFCRSNSFKRDAKSNHDDREFQRHHVIQEAAKELEEHSIQLHGDEASALLKQSNQPNKALPVQVTPPRTEGAHRKRDRQDDSARFQSFEANDLNNSGVSNSLYKEAAHSRIGQGTKALGSPSKLAPNAAGRDRKKDGEEVFSSLLEYIQGLSKRDLTKIKDGEYINKLNSELDKVKEAIAL